MNLCNRMTAKKKKRVYAHVTPHRSAEHEPPAVAVRFRLMRALWVAVSFFSLPPRRLVPYPPVLVAACERPSFRGTGAILGGSRLR